MAFEAVLDEAELWIGELRAVRVDGAPVLLVRLDSGVCAYRDRCPHLGYPLSEGSLENGVITCSAHRHCFDARTGAGINPLRSCLVALPLRVEAGRILVDAAPRVGSDARRGVGVGPVLESSDFGRAVLTAILSLNSEVRVQDQGAYLRVLAAERCFVTRAAIEIALGRPVQLPGDLEQVMPSFKGRLQIDSERACWEAGSS